MKRRFFIAGLAAGVAFAAPALAQSIVDSILRQLKQQGFRSIVQETTLLGRVRITAERKDGFREIIVNPKTSEILRDLWTPVAGGAAAGIKIIDEPESGGGKNGDDGADGDDDNDDDGENGGGSGGGGGSDDDDDEDDDDDDDDDDE